MPRYPPDGVRTSTLSHDLPAAIAFLERHGVDRKLLIRAGEIAESVGVSPEAALLGEGWISEKAFYTALADHIGVPYYDGTLRAAQGTDPDAAIAHGFVRLAPNAEGCRAVVAPRDSALRLLVECAARSTDPLPIALASRQRLATCLRAQSGDAIAERAANGLADRHPAFSAKTRPSLWQIGAVLGAVAAVAAGAAYAPAALRLILSLAFWAVFSGAVWLRSMAIGARGVSREEPTALLASSGLGDDKLPLYTIIAPLYREGRVVAELVRSLAEINYPGIR